MFLKRNNKKNNQVEDSKKINEEFEVGKANMEYPDYEIKIAGQVPVDYAKAIDDRQKRVKKIEDDFKEKDKIEDEFEKETAQHKEMTESFYSPLYDTAIYLSQQLNEFIVRTSSLSNIDEFLVDSDFSKLNDAIEVLDRFATLYGEVTESKEDITEEKTRNRSKNTKKEDKMYSSDDKWLQVYDDLSSEVENQGPGKEINKQVKIPRGKRFSGPYAGPGDYDLTVYATNRDDLKWAKKVADHYGVDIDIKEDKSKNTYYPWYAILRDIR